jgi:hypothetical protein
MSWDRALLSVDLVGSLAVMVEASYYDNKFICACGLVLVLTSMWLLSKLPK